MKWFILENVILLLALIAYLLMRDPKKGAPKRPGSVGIHGVNGKNKIGRDDSVDESVETPDAKAAATSELEEKPAKGAAKTADEVKTGAPKNETAKQQPAAQDAPAKAEAPAPKNAPSNGQKAAAAGAAASAGGAASAAADDWDAAPAPAPGTPAAPAASSGDDWDAPAPALDATAAPAAPAQAAPAASGSDDWDAPAPALDDSAPADAAPAASGRLLAGSGALFRRGDDLPPGAQPRGAPAARFGDAGAPPGLPGAERLPAPRERRGGRGFRRHRPHPGVRNGANGAITLARVSSTR